MKISIPKITLLGAALATAVPIANDATLSQQNTVRLADILPDGTAPFYMAQISDPAAELERNPGLLDDLLKRLGAAIPHLLPNSIVTVVDLPPEANETRNASAPALVGRQESACPKACAPWVALPPFGVWFPICLGDCHHRCVNVMNSPPGMSREVSATAEATDKPSSPRQKAQESQTLPPLPPSPPPLNDADRDPSPLPRWLQLRIKASVLWNRSRRHGPGNVFVLPFGKVAKLNVSVTEIAALSFVRANTSIPVPEVLEVHHDAKFEGFANIVMTKLPGDDLADIIHKMSDAEIKSVVKQLSGYLKQLRRLEKDAGGDAPAIGGVGATPGYDSRIASIPFGPFATVADFHTYLRLRMPIEDWADIPEVMAVHGKPEGAYKMKLTHGDIAPRNIRVKHGRIVGIIDWEFSGWYPEYWEYTRMFFPGEWPGLKRWYNAIEEEDDIGKYKTERKGEEVIWSRHGPFGFE